MSARDRTVMFTLVVAAVVAWVLVAVVFTNLSPVGDAGAQLLGALGLGAAVGLTTWPLLWSMGRATDGEGRSGGLADAARRAGLVGLVISILVVLRALDAVALPVLLFLVITVVLVEVAFTLRR